jgi:CDP-6-deoxy-D-xylo-4-hexulose-3-dehydrase
MSRSLQQKVWYAPNRKQAYGSEEIDAVVECLEDGWLAGFGKYSVKFQEKVSELFGKKYGLFVNSGSSACLLALACLDLKAGSEVVTPACTFNTTVAPIIQLGLKPVFCDVELTSYVPTVRALIDVITPNTKALMLPNLIGNKPDWSGIRQALNNMGRSDIYLIEDSADTITLTPDTDVSTTSFYASHIITAGGTGGMVMFNDEKHMKRAIMLRDWGRIGDNSEAIEERFAHEVDGIPYDYKFLYGGLGYNMKCNEMAAAFGLAQLKKLHGFITHRRKLFNKYKELLKDIPQIKLPDDSIAPLWLAIPLQTNNRLELLTYLEKENIQTRVLFAGNVTRHPVYREYLQDFPNSDTIMKNGFLLGCHHGMTIEDVEYVCGKIKAFYK